MSHAEDGDEQSAPCTGCQVAQHRRRSHLDVLRLAQVKENVVGLNVQVDDAVLVQKVEPLENLACPPTGSGQHEPGTSGALRRGNALAAGRVRCAAHVPGDVVQRAQLVVGAKLLQVAAYTCIQRMEVEKKKKKNISERTRSAPGAHQERTRSTPGAHQERTKSAPGAHQERPFPSQRPHHGLAYPGKTPK